MLMRAMEKKSRKKRGIETVDVGVGGTWRDGVQF